MIRKLCVFVGVACLPFTLHAADMDADTATAILKKNNCFKCHSMDKKKDGTPYKEVAKKYKGKADAEDRLFKHVTSGPKVKLEDGTEEEHKKIKTNSDDETRALIHWIVSL